MPGRDLRGAVERAAAVLSQTNVASTISSLERELSRADLTTAMRASARLGLDGDLLVSALRARRDLGRINDIVHATAILVSLPALLEANEVIRRPPSLTAANVHSRRFDLETNRRLAEFRFAVWDGSDVGRQRGLVADLAHLALHDQTDRRLRQLYVVGERPIEFLRTTRSKLISALARGGRVKTDLVEAQVDLEMPISEFLRDLAGDVELIDLCERVPEVGHTIEALGTDSISDVL